MQTAQWRWFIPLLPVSDTCWRVQDCEETLNCWKIEVKSSRVVLSYWFFEHSIDCLWGTGVPRRNMSQPQKAKGLWKANLSQIWSWAGSTSACPPTMLVVIERTFVQFLLFLARATFPLHRKHLLSLRVIVQSIYHRKLNSINGPFFSVRCSVEFSNRPQQVWKKSEKHLCCNV